MKLPIEPDLFPTVVELQTHSRCNAACTICPYPVVEDEVSHGRMSDTDIDRVLTDCASHVGRIRRLIPYLNNEPFLDKRFVSILRRIRQLAPHLEIEVSTNLSPARPEQLREILAEKLVDDFRVSFFGGDKETYERLMPGLKFEKSLHLLREVVKLHSELRSPVDFHVILVLVPDIDMVQQVRLLEEIVPPERIRLFGYLDRAKANVQENTAAFEPGDELAGCAYNRLPERLCILYDGSVITCSQDWRRENIIGNVLKTSVQEVVASPAYRELLEKIRGIRPTEDNFICKRCKLAIIKKAGAGECRNFKGDSYSSADDQDRPRTPAELIRRQSRVRLPLLDETPTALLPPLP